MNDLWHECFDPKAGLSSNDFAHMFCRVCQNPSCSRSFATQDKWAKRIATQTDRLLVNPRFADIQDPKYQDIRGVDFPSAIQQAMRIEVANRMNDWSVPTERAVGQLVAQQTTQQADVAKEHVPAPPPQVDVEDDEDIGTVLRSVEVRGSGGKTYKVRLVEIIVGKAKWECECDAFRFGRANPCKHIQFAMEVEPEPAAPPEPVKPTSPTPPKFQAPPAPVKETATPPVTQPTPPPLGRPFMPSAGNVPMPPGGVMVDGSAPPLPRLRDTVPKATQDSWDAPPAPKKKQDTVIPVGGKIVMGGKK